MYFNKKRWKMYLRYRTYRLFLTCHDNTLLSWRYYITHTEEEIWAAEKEAIQELRDFFEQLKLQQREA